jgi:arabinofuranosyltransferase
LLRDVPDGYLETLSTGTNRLRDRGLAEYYDHLSLVTTGPLLSSKRLRTVAELLAGKYEPLIRGYSETHTVQRQP